MLSAVLREKSHPLIEPLVRRAPRVPRGADTNPAFAHGVQPEHRAQQLRPARADEARDADDFAASKRQRRAVGQPHAADVVEFRHDVAGLVRHVRKGFVQAAAGHGFDDVRDEPIAGTFPRDLRRLDRSSVAQHGVALRHAVHFLEEVTDVHDRDASLAQTIDHVEEPLRLGPRQRTGRLVHHDHARLECQRPRHFYQLPRPRRQGADDGVGQKVRLLEPSERGVHALAGCPAIDDAPARRFAAQQDVLFDRQMRRERQFLIDHRDAAIARVLGTARRVRLAVKTHRPGVWKVRAGQNLHQRALAGAVLADERVRLAGLHVEVDARQRDDRSEPFGDLAHVEAGHERSTRRIYLMNDRSGESSAFISG